MKTDNKTEQFTSFQFLFVPVSYAIPGWLYFKSGSSVFIYSPMQINWFACSFCSFQICICCIKFFMCIQNDSNSFTSKIYLVWATYTWNPSRMQLDSYRTCTKKAMKGLNLVIGHNSWGFSFLGQLLEINSGKYCN